MSVLGGLLLLQSMLLMLLKQHPAAGRLVFANQQTHAKAHSPAGLFCRLPGLPIQYRSPLRASLLHFVSVLGGLLLL